MLYDLAIDEELDQMDEGAALKSMECSKNSGLPKRFDAAHCHNRHQLQFKRGD